MDNICLKVYEAVLVSLTLTTGLVTVNAGLESQPSDF